MICCQRLRTAALSRVIETNNSFPPVALVEFDWRRCGKRIHLPAIGLPSPFRFDRRLPSFFLQFFCCCCFFFVSCLGTTAGTRPMSRILNGSRVGTVTFLIDIFYGDLDHVVVDPMRREREREREKWNLRRRRWRSPPASNGGTFPLMSSALLGLHQRLLTPQRNQPS